MFQKVVTGARWRLFPSPSLHCLCGAGKAGGWPRMRTNLFRVNRVPEISGDPPYLRIFSPRCFSRDSRISCRKIPSLLPGDRSNDKSWQDPPCLGSSPDVRGHAPFGKSYLSSANFDVMGLCERVVVLADDHARPRGGLGQRFSFRLDSRENPGELPA